MNSFQNAYDFALDETTYISEGHAEDGTLTSESVYYAAEQALNDWDGFVGPRRTNYVPEQYELTNSQWYDCLSAVCETVCARLEVED